MNQLTERELIQQLYIALQKAVLNRPVTEYPFLLSEVDKYFENNKEE